MTAPFEPHRSDAIRAMLVEHAAPQPAGKRRGLWAAILVLAGAVLGAGLSTAALAASGQFSVTTATPSGEPTPDLGPAIDAPAGTIPGSPIVVILGNSAALSVTQETTFSLADRPVGATHVRVSVTPETAGTLYWGTDPGGNNPSMVVGPSDLGSEGWSEYDFPLDSSTDTLYFTPFSGFTAVASIQYITEVPTHLGVNGNGESYGVEGGPDGTPDLVLVWATAPDGTQLEAYARTSDLDAMSPDHPGQPTSPAQALERQDERGKKYPNGWEIPAFTSDGITQVGTFHIG